MKKTGIKKSVFLSTSFLAFHTFSLTYAQENTVVEEVIVTGLRASLEKSIEIKRASTSIVEAVSSEDIGKLPDKSIAESLMRLPGLATQRLNGRAQIISIRGMSPDFGATLLNGRQQVSTGNSRSVEYDQYPAEFTSTALVYKTPNAALIGQGVSGTVDIRTVRPLDHDERTVALNIRYEENAKDSLNSDGDNQGDKETFSYIDQFNDGTLGLALGLSHTNSPIQGEKFNAWGYGTEEDNTGNEYAIINGVKPFVQTTTLKRNSLIGTVEFQPNDTFYTALDIFYSDFSEDQLLRGIELPLAASSAELQPGYTVNNGVITDGVFTNVMGVIRSDATLLDAELYAVGLNGKLALNDMWETEWDVSYSSADRDSKIVENYSGYVDGADTLTFHTSDTGTRFQSILDYSDPSHIRLTNLQNWGGTFVPVSEGGQKGYLNSPSSEDELTQIKFILRGELNKSIFSQIEFGVNYDDRSKFVTTIPEYYFAYPNGAREAPLPENTALTDLSFIGMGNIISFSPLDPLNNGTYELIEAIRADVTNNTWQVDESVWTAYAKIDIDTQLGDFPLKGNIGVQAVYADQTSHARRAGGEADSYTETPVSGGDSYSHFLPSVNLTMELSDNDILRFGLARSLTRPRMDQMRAAANFSISDVLTKLEETSDIDNSPWSASRGNPNLRPWISDNVDLAYEHYFDNSATYFSLAAYYKYLDTYIYDRKDVIDFSAYPIPDSIPMQPNLFLGYDTYPVNGKGGYVRGIETSISLAGESFAELLTGFGVLLNYSYNQSDIAPENTPLNTLPGLSKSVYGIQAYYERAGFSARISQNYRSKFLGPVTSNVGNRDERIVRETTLMDAQIGYTFEGGTFEGLGIIFQAYNLNDEPFVTLEEGDKNRVVDYSLYGRTYALSLNYKI